MSYDKDAETVCLEFGSELAVGEVVFSFSYTGCLNDQMRGFYRSKYVVDGEDRYAAVTQFEVRQSIITIHTLHSWFFILSYPTPTRLLRLGGLCLAGMNQLIKHRMMLFSLCPKTEWLSPTWYVQYGCFILYVGLVRGHYSYS